MIASVIDISERKRAEEALKESEERHRMLVENATVGIVMLDVENRVLDVDLAFEEMFQYSKEE